MRPGVVATFVVRNTSQKSVGRRNLNSMSDDKEFLQPTSKTINEVADKLIDSALDFDPKPNNGLVLCGFVAAIVKLAVVESDPVVKNFIITSAIKDLISLALSNGIEFESFQVSGEVVMDQPPEGTTLQ